MKDMILTHFQAKIKFEESGIIVPAASVVPVRFHLHCLGGKLKGQFGAWEGQKDNGVKCYLSFSGKLLDRYSWEYKNYQVSRIQKQDGFQFPDGTYLTLVIDNEYVRAFDTQPPLKRIWKIKECCPHE